jgi:hypothetical protein
MQPDVPGGGRERGEVLLEDLDGFAVEDAHGEMREWEDGMELPLQPLVVSSRKRKRRVDQDLAYGVIATEDGNVE